MFGRCICASLFAILAAGMVGGLEVIPANPVPVFSLIRVNLAEGERAWVLASDLLPVEVAKTTTGLVFTGPPGRYAVLAFTATTQDQQIVEIVGDVPDPDPDPGPGPDPDPGPEPDPDDDPPADLINKYGLGIVAWRAARAVGRPVEARTLSQAYLQRVSQLHEFRLTVNDAQRQVRQVREGLSGNWSAWEDEIETGLRKAIQQHGRGVLYYRNYFYEIGKALEAAAR